MGFTRLEEEVRQFCEERDWDQFHGLKDLSIGLVTEASELLEEFRFLDAKQCEERMENTLNREGIEDEMADVLFFLLRIAQKYEVNLEVAFERKMKKNATKYPLEKARGSAKKYTEW